VGDEVSVERFTADACVLVVESAAQRQRDFRHGTSSTATTDSMTFDSQLALTRHALKQSDNVIDIVLRIQYRS